MKAASAVDREYAILFVIRKAMRAGVDGSCFFACSLGFVERVHVEFCRVHSGFCTVGVVRN